MSKSIKDQINNAIADEQKFEIEIAKIIESLKAHKDDK